MNLGVRQIRTAGKGSGSIELTLPADLRDLVGLPCRIILRDGSRPDIVLQPDLQTAHRAFSTLWQAMAATLLRDDASPPALPLAAFGFGLQPRTGSGGMPFLCWRDGLALAASPPHEAGAVSRTMAAFGHALAAALDIDPALASGFGAACGYLVSGVAATSDAQEACDLAALHLGQPNGAPPLTYATDAMDSAFWRLAAPLLAATAELFAGWSTDPSGHATLRAAWRRGRTIEMSGDQCMAGALEQFAAARTQQGKSGGFSHTTELGGDKARIVSGYTVRIGPDSIAAKPFGVPVEKPRPDAAPALQPIVEVFEDGNAVVVVAELPGADDEHIVCRADGVRLLIEATGARRYRKELTLPVAVRVEGMRQTYRNGILEVRMTRTDTA